MRYNNIIILRITDFQNYFTFEEFWKNRELFPRVSAGNRFHWASMDRGLENHCINVVNEWLSGSPFTYRNEGFYLYDRRDRFIGTLDKEVYSFLASQNDPVIASNLLGLCCLYQLLPEEKRNKVLKEEIDVIKHALELARIDFSKDYVQFEEAGRTITIPLDRSARYGEEGCHWVLMHNESERHQVCLCDNNDRADVFKVIGPSEYCLALFDKGNDWIAEKPFKYTAKKHDWALEMKATGKKMSLIYREIRNEVPVFEMILSDDVVSYSADSSGVVFLVHDSFKPIRTRHPAFDADTIRRFIRDHLDADENIIDLRIMAEGLDILTSKRIHHIGKTQL